MALPLAVIAGVPAYLNGYAAIPLVRSLIDLGMPASTGLAFMLAGSVTSIPAALFPLSGGWWSRRLSARANLATCQLTNQGGLVVAAVRTGRTNSALQMATLSLSFRPSRPAYGQAVYG